MARTSTLVAVAGVALAGCNPFDPNLGEQPFKCGDTDPRCPSGYECVEYSPTNHVCEREAGPGPDGGGGVDCQADSMLEPNESITDPTIIPIPGIGEDYVLSGAVVCSMVDRDVFRFQVDMTGKNVRVQVDYDADQGPLVVNMLNSTGVSIRAAEPVDDDPDHLRADFLNLALGDYYGQVQAATTSVRASYAISFKVTASPLPP